MYGVTETPYDLRFRALGIPVRVHPLFWLGTALMAGSSNDLSLMVTWIGCVFISILVHEYGHGLMAKAVDSPPSIVLWVGGGLCYSQTDRETRLQRLAIVLCGPGAGFLLAVVVMLVTSAVYGLAPGEHLGVVLHLLDLPTYGFHLTDEHYGQMGEGVRRVYGNLIFINVLWSLVNLLPIFPLDGGRVSEIVLSYFNPREGRRWSHIISLVLAGLLAVLTFARIEDGSYFLPFFFLFFAIVNYQILNSIHQAQSYGLSNDEDWWRR
jgi:stage IV sporulation protein FB